MKYTATTTVEGLDFIGAAFDANITKFDNMINDLNGQLDDIAKKINDSTIPSSVFTFDNTTTVCAFSQTAASPIFGCNIKPGIQGEKGFQGDRGINGEMGDKGIMGPQGETGKAVVYQSFQFN